MPSTNWSTNGGTAALRMVTALRGCKSCTKRSEPFFFGTQNQRERYDASERSYTPAAIFSLNMSMTLSSIPVGIGMFLYTQGVWATVGILTGEK